MFQLKEKSMHAFVSPDNVELIVFVDSRSSVFRLLGDGAADAAWLRVMKCLLVSIDDTPQQVVLPL
jgi:hypothetical protein